MMNLNWTIYWIIPSRIRWKTRVGKVERWFKRLADYGDKNLEQKFRAICVWHRIMNAQILAGLDNCTWKIYANEL